PHQMSGGQCQRVMIAIAIACQPKLLIADEPTTALDVTIQKQILDLLMKLQEDTGMGLIMITHDMGVVAETADRVVVMYKGRKMEEAGVLEIFEAPKHPYTRALLSALPELATGDRLPTVSDFIYTEALAGGA
ncbi:ATP-binding cassette domain-containing protein, partial [Rhodovulum sulfidophilum]|nr:ATP-binding cassette domain-containing protein [Rhodovulum sulfidophilum]